jgi:hypothetical protein
MSALGPKTAVQQLPPTFNRIRVHIRLRVFSILQPDFIKGECVLFERCVFGYIALPLGLCGSANRSRPQNGVEPAARSLE